MKTLRILSFLLSVLFATSVYAGNPSDGKKKWRKGPPQKLFDACVDKAEGDACSFEGRKGTVEGTCSIGRKSDDLMCKPKDGFKRKRGHKGPPQKLFDACVDKAEGDACSFEGRKGTVEGTCSIGHKSDDLMCKPKDGFKRKHGRKGPPQEAFDACVDMVEGDACFFEGRRGTMDGTCNIGRKSDQLVCKPDFNRKKENDNK